MIKPIVSGLSQLILCEEEPDSRCKLTEKLTEFGFSVLATGNPHIAAGLIQERTFGALVVSMDRLRLSTITAVVDARRARPDLPIVIIVGGTAVRMIPPGLADLVLVTPGDRKLRDSLVAFLETTVAMPVAC